MLVKWKFNFPTQRGMTFIFIICESNRLLYILTCKLINNLHFIKIFKGLIYANNSS